MALAPTIPQQPKNNVYQSSNYQPGWGIGYATPGNGFNSFNDPTAVQQEIARVNTVMGNRTQFGHDNSGYDSYLNQLNSAYAPYKPVDTDKYRTESATVADLANKYGFDYSRDYAKTQAEAEAQAKRNAVADAQRRNTSNRDVNLKSIDNNLMGMSEGLDRDYFQRYMGQAQDQTNSGMNSGIAADQNLRMAMSRQAEMGGAYRDANLGRMKTNEQFSLDDVRLAEELGLVNQQALAREDSLFNDRLLQAFGQIQNLNDFSLRENGMLLDAALGQRGQNIGMNQFSQDMGFRRDQADISQQNWVQEFQRMLGRDTRGDFESDRGFDRGVFESDRGFNRGVLESDRDFNWSKQLANMQRASASAPNPAAAQASASNLSDLYAEFQRSVSNQSQNKSYAELLAEYLSKNGTLNNAQGGSGRSSKDKMMMQF